MKDNAERLADGLADAHDQGLADAGLGTIEFDASSIDVKRAAEVYQTHGCLVVRGLYHDHVAAIAADIETVCERATSLLNDAVKIPEGWRTPDGTLWIPAPDGHVRDKQLMVIGLNYQTSSAFFRSALDTRALDIVEAILGPDVELFMNGQSLVKEPVGGHAKHMHQDSGYFEHRYQGPVAILTYVVRTTYENGALHVVPGSHRLGQLKHIDTSSHLGLDGKEWPIERGLRIDGDPGDAIFFHVKTIHGSPSNHSNAPRPVFIHRYRAANDYVVVSATNTENRAAAERHIEEAKKENQLGLLVRGFRRDLR